MRKEVKRSLLLWPAAASATILAVSWLPTDYQPDPAVPRAPQAPQIVTVPRVAKPLTTGPVVVTPEVELPARNEYGARAMKLPERVAEVFGVPARMVKAPIRDEGQELAGLGIASSDANARGIDRETVDSLLRDLAKVAAAAAAEPQVVSSNALLSVNTLPSLRRRMKIRPAPGETLETTPVWLVGPGRPEFWEPAIKLVDVPHLKRPSVLPKSTRALARRDLSLSDETPLELSKANDSRVLTHSEVRDVFDSLIEAFEAVRPPSSPATVAATTASHTKPGSSSALDKMPGSTVALTRKPGIPSALATTPESPSASAVSEWLGGDRPRLARLPEQEQTPKVESRAGRPQEEARGDRSPAGWPVTQQLSQQLETLAGMAHRDRAHRDQKFVTTSATDQEMLNWSDDVSQRLLELQSLPRLGAPRAGELIDELEQLADRGRRQAEQLEDRDQQVQWLRTSHGISRRLAVWRPVWQLSQQNASGWTEAEQHASIGVAVEQVRIDLEQTGDVAGWNSFLMLDAIQKAAQESDMESRSVLAQRFLSRLQWHKLDSEQLRWLERDSVAELSAAVRPWARKAIDYANLMGQIEQQEANAIDLAAIDIASAAQTLRFAESREAIEVSKGINTYYRNANVRIAITEAMLERMLPVIEPHSVPVNTRILGSNVRGTSRIESGFDLELQPSMDRWKLALRTQGRVSTRSAGVRDGVTVRTAAASQFDAATPIEVTRRGVYVGDSEAGVTGRTQLRGIETNYDGWPLVGSLVRSIAQDRYNSNSATAGRMANQQVRVRIESEIDEQLNQEVDEAASKLSEMVLGPLGRLQLEPQVTDMQTTDQRLLARYRVAGDWQLAAFTPRPRALSTSLMSIQVHQSALNNTLEQLVPNEAPMSIREMIQNGAATFGQQELELPDDIPADVTVQFARTRPITVEIEEGRLWVTLRVLRLRRDERLDLTQFIVRAAYKPEVNGMNARLVRDGHLRISGPRMSMRERLPVRAIFNKVLSPNRPIVMTMPQLTEHPAAVGLAISQLELRNGWIAMAVSEESSPRIALAD
ncbi:MAG: hypothetical protein ACR2NZ_16725 [Rubripirellula sp.]